LLNGSDTLSTAFLCNCTDMGMGRKSADLLETNALDLTHAVGTCIYMAPEQIDGGVSAKV
jgi:hypothetical protein